MQFDGNVTVEIELEPELQIPVHISKHRLNAEIVERPPPVRKTLKRSPIIMQSIELPVIMNINPRSLYNKVDDLKLILDQ